MVDEKNKDKKEIEKIRAELYSVNAEEYGDRYNQHLFEEYKLYVNMMDKTSERRAKANTFFLAINSAIIGLMGLISRISGGTLIFNVLWIVMSASFGILLCICWEEIIKSYKDLNTGRFVIIHLLEEKLPAKLYKAEWDYLDPEDGEPRYTPMTNTEKRVPKLFKILYAIFIIIVIASYLLSQDFYRILTQICA